VDVSCWYLYVSMVCCVERFRDAQSIDVNQYLLVLWFAVLGLINFPIYGSFSDVAVWNINERLKYMPDDRIGV
jgi:hypothetical protein